MPLIQVNLNEVPDEIQPIAAGVHLFRVDESPTIQPTKKDPTSNNVVVVLTKADGEDAGRKVRDYIYIGSAEVPNQMGLMKLKKAALAFGVEFSDQELDTNLFTSKTGRAEIVNSVYTDDSGSSRQTANVRSYVPAG
jgi:hypothetical protein